MDKRPNILFILCDQLRPDFLGCYGASFIETPNIDSIARTGVQCTHAVSPSPVCVPARASLLSGKNGISTGVLNNNQWLVPDQALRNFRSWTERVKVQGYSTAAIGKMHFYPWDSAEGFEERVIAEDKRHYMIQDDYADFLERNGYRKHHANELPGYYEQKGAVLSELPPSLQVDSWVADKSVDYINRRAKDRTNPFALMIGFPGPHCPYDPSEEYLDTIAETEIPRPLSPTDESEVFLSRMVASQKRPWNGVDYTEFTEQHINRIRHYYGALIKQIDDGVGRVIKALKENGFADDTVIIFSSDHGDFLGDYKMIGKYYGFEPSIRVPLLVQGPGFPRGVTLDHAVSLTDIYASICTISGISVESNDDSVSLQEQISSRQRGGAIFGATDLCLILTNNRYKLVRYRSGECHLFDLERDPTERNNRASDPDYSEVLAAMDSEMTQRIMNASLEASSPLHVAESSSLGKGQFGERNWKRPFPPALIFTNN